jgi:hypothetical protein
MALLQQQLTGAVQHEQRESPVEDARTVMTGGFLQCADGLVCRIYQDEQVGVVRDDTVLMGGQAV